MTPLANIQMAMPVLFFPSLFCFLMQLLKRCETFSLKKKATQEYPQPYDRFFPNSRLRVTLRRQISIKGRRECRNSDYHTILLLFCSFEKYLKFENSLFLKLQDMTSVQAAPGSLSMSQYTVNPLPAAS